MLSLILDFSGDFDREVVNEGLISEALHSRIPILVLHLK